MKRSLVTFALVGIVAALVFLACQKDLPPDYQLTDSRVLAIRATPPELVPSGQTTLDALVYAPAGSPSPTYAWSWCAQVDASFNCTMTAAALTTLLDPTGTSGVTIDYSLGSAATATFTYPATPELIRAACTRRAGDGGADDGGDGGDASDDADADAGDDDAGDDAGDGGVGANGLRCTGNALTIDILLTVTVGDKVMQSARELTLSITTPASINQNPSIAGLLPFTSATELTDAGALADADLGADGSIVDAAVGAIVNGGIELAADVPTAASELENNDNGNDNGGGGPGNGDGGDDGGDGGSSTTATGPQTYEALSLAWYVERGQLDHPTTTLAVARSATEVRDWNALLANRWVPPSGTTTTGFILVIRDDRGGVGWLSTTAATPLP